jgi:hypothetical protein
VDNSRKWACKSRRRAKAGGEQEAESARKGQEGGNVVPLKILVPKFAVAAVVGVLVDKDLRRVPTTVLLDMSCTARMLVDEVCDVVIVTLYGDEAAILGNDGASEEKGGELALHN